MLYVDLAFRLTGSKVPVDHGYALYSAISRVVPEIHEAKSIGLRLLFLSIEVKGIGSATGTVLLTPNERRVAEDRRDCYWL